MELFYPNAAPLETCSPCLMTVTGWLFIPIVCVATVLARSRSRLREFKQLAPGRPLIDDSTSSLNPALWDPVKVESVRQSQGKQLSRSPACLSERALSLQGSVRGRQTTSLPKAVSDPVLPLITGRCWGKTPFLRSGTIWESLLSAGCSVDCGVRPWSFSRSFPSLQDKRVLRRGNWETFSLSIQQLSH